MAVVNRNSTQIANSVATPRVINDPPAGPAVLKSVKGVWAPAADDSATSVHRAHRIPSNACVRAVILLAGNAATAGAGDVGIYETVENGGAVVDADLFASAQALTSSAAARGLDVTFESGEYTIAESLMPLWQVLGLASDPKKDYDVAYTITTTHNGGPTSMAIETQFVQ